MGKQYKQEQDKKNILKIREILKILPHFMKDYFIYLTESRQLSSVTVLGYARDMETFCYFLKNSNPEISDYSDISPKLLNELKPQDIAEYMSFLTLYEKNGEMQENTANGKARKLSALKSFWKWMIGFEIVNNNPTLLITPPKQKKKEIIKLEKDEIKDVLDGIETSEGLAEQRARSYAKNINKRDFAMISLFLATGIRVSECVGLDVSDISFKDNSARIIRKGGDEARVYFNDIIAERLRDYIENERKTPIDGSDALFLSTQNKRMCVRSAERRVKKYTENVVLDKHISAHKLRSTFATHLYRESHDIYLVSESLSHKNISTTAKYADVGDTRRKEVAEYDIIE